MDYFVYKTRKVEELFLPENYKVSREIPNMFSSKHAFVWTVFKGSGFFYRYILHYNNTPVSFADVVDKSLFLRFLPKNCIHIGPCYTPIQYRGHGFYPMLLRFIINEYKDKECYMFVKQNNISSIRGIEKAGFKRIGICKKLLNFYFLDDIFERT